MEDFDLIVIGLGPAGMRACQSALKNGLSVAAFEQNSVGGCCLNKGCIPTKTILHYLNLYSEINSSPIFDKTDFNFEKIIEKKDEIVKKLSLASENELVKKGLKIIKEKGIVDFENKTVNNSYRAKNIIIATGSIPYELPNLPFGGNILSSDDILELKNLPKSVAIIGTGAIGIEWARIFLSANINVTLIEKAPCILPLMDVDIQTRIQRFFKIKKVPIYLNTTAIKYENNKLYLDNAKEIEADIVLVAVGRKKIIPNGLKTNADLSTNYENIYAIGDNNTKTMLAHSAYNQAEIVINKILGKNSTNEALIPSVLYGNPEAAQIGLIENDIENKNEYKIYKLPLSYLPKAWCDNCYDGFIKIITKDDEIKGASIISKEASSLIGIIQALIVKKAKIEDIEKIIFAHPTYSEGIFEALRNG